MPTDRQKAIEALMESDIAEIRAAGYESTAQDREAALDRYRAGNTQQGEQGGQQQTSGE